MPRKKKSGNALINVKACAFIPVLVFLIQLVLESYSLKDRTLTALEIENERLNNSVSLFFSKTISLTRQRKKVRAITIHEAREHDIEKKLNP
jgi:hypothetical protein